MTLRSATEDYAGLIAIRVDGVDDPTPYRGLVAAALDPFASEPLVWEAQTTLARLRREAIDLTTSLRVLAIEQTLQAAIAIRDAIVSNDVVITLACDVEPFDAEPTDPAYWVRRQRLDNLLTSGIGQTLCRRGMIAARPLRLQQLRMHFEETDDVRNLRLVAGQPTSLTWEVGRSVIPYVEGVPGDEAAIAARRDIAAYASPGGETRVVLVLAEAWVGKSYVAGKLYEALLKREMRVHRTSFEDEAPDWPDNDFLNESRPRVWIVDAVDEAERRGCPVERLGRATGKQGLTTLVFTRPDGTLRKVEEALGLSRRSPGANEVSKKSRLRLLPLDDDQVRREFADVLEPSSLERLLDAAGQYGVPLAYAELLVLAEHVRRPRTPEKPDLRAIRHEVARHRCTRWRIGRPDHAIAEDEMLAAAQLIAAVAALANEPLFHFGDGRASGFAVNAVVPKDLLAAALALRDTTALLRRGDGYQFAAAHLEEDLAGAFLVDAIVREVPAIAVSTLRALLSDGRQPRPGLQRVIARAREGLEGSGKLAVLDQALKAFAPGEAVRHFQAMVAAARKSTAPLWAMWTLSDGQLTWLDAPPVESSARALLSDPTEPASVRHLVLRVAIANHWKDLAPDATRIALSSLEPAEVRQLAVVLAAEGGQIESLRALLGGVARETTDEDLAQLRAQLVIELLRGGLLSPLEAARECPPASPRVADHRSMAIAEVATRLDADGARGIVDELRAPAGKRTIHETVLEDMRGASVARFLETDPRDANEDVDRIMYVIKTRDWSVADEGRALDGLTKDVRRAVYMRMDIADGESSGLFRVASDAEWLIDSAAAVAKLRENVCADVFAAIQELERGAKSSAAERGREILRREGVWEKFEARLASAAEWETKQKEWARARELRAKEARETALPVERVVDTFLGDRRDASMRLHVLGDYFFGERRWGTNVVGTFDEDLSPAQRAAILDATWDALNQATPLKIPTGNPFSTLVLDEGNAFAAVALRQPDRLDAGQIARWLPAALFTGMMDSELQLEDLLERCFAAAPAETRKVVVDDLAREARMGRAPTHRIPSALWRDEGFRRDLIELIRRLAAGTHSEHEALDWLLLDLLQVVEAAIAPRDVRALLDQLAGSPDSTRATSGIRAWFYRWPEESADRALARVGSIDDALAVFAPYFSQSARYYLRAVAARRRRQDLSLGVTARVVKRILSLVPETPDFPNGDRDSLAAWRDDLVQRCIDERDQPEVAEAIGEIRRRPPYSDWLQAAIDRRNIGSALEATPRPWPTAEEVARVLRGTLILVHDAGELALLVAEIARTPKDPSLTELLYQTDETGREKRHAHERSLQILLREQLEVGLRSVQPPVEAIVVREPHEGIADEPDFLVVTTDQAPRLEVPVEIKWSDNTKIVAGLSDQLGERYLGNSGRTHGVFVVGLTGQPPGRAQLEPKLEAAKARQAERGRTIHIVFRDFSYPTVKRAASKPE